MEAAEITNGFSDPTVVKAWFARDEIAEALKAADDDAESIDLHGFDVPIEAARAAADTNGRRDLDSDPFFGFREGQTVIYQGDPYKVRELTHDKVGPVLSITGISGPYQMKWRSVRPATLAGLYETAQKEKVEKKVTRRKKRAKKADNAGKTGKCEHCGAPTGGRFAVGHDAKLKGELLKAARDGDAEAAAEMVYRTWWDWTKAERELPTEQDLDQARGILDADDEAIAKWITRRVTRRQEG